jgi:hypothetical protein
MVATLTVQASYTSNTGSALKPRAGNLRLYRFMHLYIVSRATLAER